MLIGYARVSKADGSQSLDLQRDALRAAPPRPTSRPQVSLAWVVRNAVDWHLAKENA